VEQKYRDDLWQGFAERSTREHGTALILGNRAVKWPEFFALLEVAKGRLCDGGVRSGDVVLLEGDYSLEIIVTFFALALNRNIILPMTDLTAAKAAEIDTFCPYSHRILEVEGEISICASQIGGRGGRSAGTNEKISGLRAGGRAGLILLSSGTTGRPKIILHDLSTLMERKFKEKTSDSNRIILLLLFDHIGGINTLIATVLSGGVCVIPGERSVDQIGALIQTHRVRTLPSSPSFLNLMLLSKIHERFDLLSLRLVTYGSELMPVNLLHRCRAALPRVRFIQTYGTSETGILRTSSSLADGTFFRIDGEVDSYKVIGNELHVRGHNRFLGYLNRDDVQDEAGWFNTGDIVEVTDDSLIRVVGRRDDIINVGGEKVFPSEVENELLKIDFIRQCRVYGLENILLGQSVCADVVVEGDMAKADARRLIFESLGATLNAYKIPAAVRFVDSIGTTERLKLIRRGH
jgi:acyl-CoA synthetase (AMP-forming)/AMP-acid ligase II